MPPMVLEPGVEIKHSAPLRGAGRLLDGSDHGLHVERLGQESLGTEGLDVGNLGIGGHQDDRHLVP